MDYDFTPYTNSCGCFPDGVTPCGSSDYPQCGGACFGNEVCHAFHLRPDSRGDIRTCACVDPATGTERVFEGRCAGRLAAAPRGERGFGYDPAFLPDDGPAGLTMAELSDAQKDAISHRGRAARAMLEWLEEVDRG